MRKILIGMIAAAFIAVPGAALAQDDGSVDDGVVVAPDDDYVEVDPPVPPETAPPETSEPPAATVPPETAESDDSVGVMPPPGTQSPPSRSLPSAGLSTLESSLRIGAILLMGGLGIVILARRRRYSALSITPT